MDDVKNGPLRGTYQHYKGPLYKVIGVCRHTETEEELVVYQSLYGNYDLWVRPLAMFCEDVEIEGYKKPRFTLLEQEK